MNNSKEAVDARKDRMQIMKEKRKRIRKSKSDCLTVVSSGNRLPLQDITPQSISNSADNFNTTDSVHKRKADTEFSEGKSRKARLSPFESYNGRKSCLRSNIMILVFDHLEYKRLFIAAMFTDMVNEKENFTPRASKMMINSFTTYSPIIDPNTLMSVYSSPQSLHTQTRKDMASEARQERLFKLGQKKMLSESIPFKASQIKAFKSSNIQSICLNFDNEDVFSDTGCDANSNTFLPVSKGIEDVQSNYIVLNQVNLAAAFHLHFVHIFDTECARNARRLRKLKLNAKRRAGLLPDARAFSKGKNESIQLGGCKT
ncbi:hypothetical protein PIB30_035620 [Stylosanthes scabra]|uniref:Uncharacterized protein n=1 Tax=Stylosanthes scabra TaxID=79078 RepID=A0ABU6YDD9_9FABA|nr:hypothetical protein [Stylosanthes scabra]